MEDTEALEIKPTSHLPQSTYESMCLSFYAYRFGTIGFLDLLDRFEEALGIQPPQTGFHNSSGDKE